MNRNTPEPHIRMELDFEKTWPGANALATECLLNIGFLANMMAKLGEELVRKHKVPSLAAFDALVIIDRAGEALPPSTIAERMVVSRPTITGIIGSLEKRGLIKRLPYPPDRRMTLIDVTPRGRTLVKKLRLILHNGERQWASCLTREEQQVLLAMLARLQANTPRP